MPRRSVVFPLPEGPRSASTSPRRSSNETPSSTCVSPSRLRTSETTSSVMDADSQAKRHRQAGADEDDVDGGERGDDVDGAGAPERHDERADDLGARAEEVHAHRVLADEDHEDEEPAPEQPEPD